MDLSRLTRAWIERIRSAGGVARSALSGAPRTPAPRGADPELETETIGASWLRPKGNLTRGEVGLLLAVAAVPLVMMVLRILALPGLLGSGGGSFLTGIGHDLNQLLSLHRVPATDRGQVLYLLFLPLGAMMIALARLTFGLRVIGFRSILIAVGFQQSGIVPSLILIAVVAAVIISVRPILVRFRLPYYARVSVIMSISALMLLGALLAAPSMRSDVLWRLGFFPVIVLGLLAEGIARTLDRDSWLAAAWRTGMTIGIALILAGIGQFPPLQELVIRFPELVISEVAAIVLISEYLDLRLFQDWDAKLSGVATPRLFSSQQGLRIAVVRNVRKGGVIGRIGPQTPEGYSRTTVRRIATALRRSGHSVKVLEGDVRLLSQVRDFMPAHPRTEEPGGLVMNLSHGIQGERSTAHVCAMLEMSGVAYTGASLYGRLVMQDRVLTTTLLRRAGLRAPDALAVRRPPDALDPAAFPLIVRPRHAFRPRLRQVQDARELEEAVASVVRRDGQEAVIEPLVAGRRIEVALIGNGRAERLPPVETIEGTDEPMCPAELDRVLERRIRRAARRAFRACECRDYALVELRVAESGKIHVLEVAEVGVLEPGGAFERAANAAGFSFEQMIGRIVDVSRARYRSASEAPKLEVVRRPDDEGRRRRRRRPAAAARAGRTRGNA